MSIVRDEGEQRQARVDRMIEEFREAQSRRLAKAVIVNGGGRVVEWQSHVRAQAAAAGSTPTPRTSP
jgi:hypothetical protein